MKVLIIYFSVGAGHFKAAEAVYNYFKRNNHDIELKLVDALKYTNSFFRNTYTYAYTLAVRHALWLWSWSFKATSLKPLRPLFNAIAYCINRVHTKRIADLLIQEGFDYIISTHFSSSEIAAFLKRARKINSFVVTLITDFGVHPFWINNGTDLYIAASDITRQLLLFEGVPIGKIKVSGIPIDEKFLGHYEKGALSKKLDIEQSKFTILIVTGSFGIGPIEEIVELLYKDVQILVICANNKRLYQRLKGKSYPQVKVFGFINNIQELMAVSDVVITKPGGLTISEVLAMELVPIFISAIPGQETENARILEKYGIGLKVEDITDIKGIVLDYKVNPDKLKRIKENIKRVKKPFAASELYNVICKGRSGTAC